MKPLSIPVIAQAVNGRVCSSASDVSVESVSTDSRKIKPGCLFVALRGETFDGHAYLTDVAGKGAVAALVDQAGLPEINGMALIHVDNTKRAMGRLATFVRRTFHQVKVIAVAGSNGKTGTKHLIHAVLSSKLGGTMSEKSFNNDIGVPITIFPVNPHHDFVILEVGTNHPGEVELLSRMSEPDIAVITSIGAEHLEFFKNLDGVRAENAQIAAGLREGGTLIINGDDAGLSDTLSGFAGNLIRFGLLAHNDLIATEIQTDLDGTHFICDGVQFFVPLIGKHIACNALAAIAVGRAMGMGDADIATGLSNSTGPEMRLQKMDANGVTILNDAYNANPSSMQAALETLAQISWPGRKIAFLGDMKELGETSTPEHQRIGLMLDGMGLDFVGCVGEASRHIASSVPTSGLNVHEYADSKLAAAGVGKVVQEGDLVLVKGSRSMQLELIAQAIVGRKTATGGGK